MNILVDTCVPVALVRALRRAGHDVVWTGDWTPDPGDEEILRVGGREDRMVITLDNDFGLFAVVRGIRHAGIVRLVAIATGEMPRRCDEALARNGELLTRGGIVTIEPARIRVRDPD